MFLKNVGQNFSLVETKFHSKKIVRPKQEFYQKKIGPKNVLTQKNYLVSKNDRSKKV